MYLQMCRAFHRPVSVTELSVRDANGTCRAHCATMERCTQKQLVELSNVERMAMFIDIVPYHITISLA